MITIPITSDEFYRGQAGPNRVETFLRAHPNEAYALHEIETALIGPEADRRLIEHAQGATALILTALAHQSVRSHRAPQKP